MDPSGPAAALEEAYEEYKMTLFNIKDRVAKRLQEQPHLDSVKMFRDEVKAAFGCEKEEGEGEDPSETASLECYVCREEGAAARCSLCSSAVHLSCYLPPLKGIPENWKCTLCEDIDEVKEYRCRERAQHLLLSFCRSHKDAGKLLVDVRAALGAEELRYSSLQGVIEDVRKALTKAKKLKAAFEKKIKQVPYKSRYDK